MKSSVLTGLDRITQNDLNVVKYIRGRKIGLVAHPASVNTQLQSALSILTSQGALVEVLLGPEHGFDGQEQDMIGVKDTSHDRGRVIYSLYGETKEDLKPKPKWISGLDAIVIDLQDVGSRYYTFVWTAVLVLEVAAKMGVQTIILDRPNPLGGDVCEGAPQRPGYRSFVGLCDVSVRHGLTIGEIVHMVARQLNLPNDAYQIIKMQGWSRSMLWKDTGLPWVLPSPNMPTVETARVYPGGCIIEGTTLSEGRGTTRPFEMWGSPQFNLQSIEQIKLEGAVIRPLSFRPTFHKHAGLLCYGIQVHITDEHIFRPYESYLRILASVLRSYEGEKKWRTEIYEFEQDRLAIDLLTGGPEYRQAIEQNADIEDVIEQERKGALLFEEARRSFFLYSE